MINIKYNSNDMRYLFLYGDDREIKHLEKYLNKVPPYMFLPSFKGIPRPEIFLYTIRTSQGNILKYCHSGLWKEIIEFCKKNNIITKGIIDDNYFKYTTFNLNIEEFKEYINSWQLTLQPREYQITAAWTILHYRQSLSQLATRSGKTLIAYIIFRYMLENTSAKNILMIVPNVSLVKQGVQDLSEYKEFFKTETVWGGGQLCESSNLTIGTFQSLVKIADKKSNKYNLSFFKKFDIVLIDECHTAKCASINTILKLDFLKNIKIKFGFTGSLPIKETIESFSCQSLLGPQIQDITTKELMDCGFITPIEIQQIHIHYTNDNNLKENYIRLGEYICGNYIETYDVCGKKQRATLPKEQQKFLITHKKELPFSIKIVKNQYINKKISQDDYITYLVDICKAKGANLLLLEQMLTFEQQKRLNVMENIFKYINKNCLVFAHHTEYLNFLVEYYTKIMPDKNIYLITGKTSIKKRESIINNLLTNNNCILFASYKCVGTGLTLKNVDYGIFAESFKSQIINKQAMGRGLCLANDKEKYILYDIIDCFPTNRLLFQGKSKETLYKKEKHNYTIKHI